MGGVYSINVQEINDAPIAYADSMAYEEVKVHTIILTGSDVEDDALTCYVTSLPSVLLEGERQSVGLLTYEDGTVINSVPAAVPAASFSNTTGLVSFRLLYTPQLIQGRTTYLVEFEFVMRQSNPDLTSVVAEYSIIIGGEQGADV